MEGKKRSGKDERGFSSRNSPRVSTWGNLIYCSSGQNSNKVERRDYQPMARKGQRTKGEEKRERGRGQERKKESPMHWDQADAVSSNLKSEIRRVADQNLMGKKSWQGTRKTKGKQGSHPRGIPKSGVLLQITSTYLKRNKGGVKGKGECGERQKRYELIGGEDCLLGEM